MLKLNNQTAADIKIFLIILIFIMIGMNNIFPQSNSENLNLRLEKNWYIQSSEKIHESGSEISNANYSVSSWFRAEVPSTVLGSLVSDGVYKNVFVSENLKKIPERKFEKAWWYRAEFVIPKRLKGKYADLEFEGINYRANIWLNGHEIADSSKIFGSFRMFSFDVSDFINYNGKNILAIEVFPPVKGDPTIGFVDWSPAPPDRNMGLWRPVKIKFSGEVSIKNPFVQSKINLKTLKEASLTVSSELKNNSQKKVSGILIGEIGKIIFSKKINLDSAEKKLVIFSPEDFPQLKINNPRLWWANQFGKPELYQLKMKFKTERKLSDETKTEFGIREVSDYINKEGFRGYKLNGKKILIKGGGWADHMFLNNSSEDLKHQIEYVKQMGLNAIRLEGFWGTSSKLYNLCDEYGIMVMVGWSCEWEWQNLIGKPADDYGAIKSPEDINLISKSWEDQIKWLRNHPSIFVWLYGSDKYPRPELEKRYLEILKKDDPTRPYLASAAEHTSTMTGKSAVKMRGPYDYIPSIYWWIDKKYGGAFGFDTEVGPGAEVPPVESIKRMIPKNDLWEIDSVWNFHCSKAAFSNLNHYNEAMDNRLGKAANLEDYNRKAQFINYENTRAMYEAFEANKFNSTGVIHWMLNSAWPKLWWQLYDYYLMPGGAFFGTKKANEPIHILYDYGNNKIIAVNNTLSGENHLTAVISVLNFNLTKMFSKEISFDLPANQAIEIFKLPEIEKLSTTYFLQLKILNKKKIASSNFYCLSTREDKLDFAKSNWYVTPEKEFADMKDLNNLKNIQLNVKSKFTGVNDKEEISAEIFNNTDELALQIVLNVTKGKSGETVLPVFWDDNYFSLLPGERRTIKGYVFKKDLTGAKPFLSISGWNIENSKN